ncbi:hypothetical protein D3C85_747860 [compost metagenome]
MLEHRLAHGVVALVGAEAQALVGFHRIGAAILQLVGADLVQQADAATFLAQVEQYATAGVGDGAQGGFELEAAIATQAEQRVAGEAFGVQAAQDRFAVGDIAQGQGDMLLAAGLIEEAVHGEHAEGRGQLGGGDKNDRHRRAPEILQGRHCNSSFNRQVRQNSWG